MGVALALSLAFSPTNRTLTGDSSNSTVRPRARTLPAVLMQPDVVEFRNFYTRPLGGIARRLLTQRIRARWRSAHAATVMGLGFAVPYIGPFRGEAARLGALMPAGQGAVVWPAAESVLAAMVDEAMLPLPDASVDYLLCVHGLEVSDRAGPMLREIWRVLAPEGRMLLIVPNRRGLWARFDTTPFGHGRPYSRGQLERLLTGALFTPLEWTSALFMPPMDRQWLVRWATVFERVGARLWPGFAGVIIVEARKELMGAIPKAVPAKNKAQLAPAGGLLNRTPRATAGPRRGVADLTCCWRR
jgi:SAM-dependent methyltransferase